MNQYIIYYSSNVFNWIVLLVMESTIEKVKINSCAVEKISTGYLTPMGY